MHAKRHHHEILRQRQLVLGIAIVRRQKPMGEAVLRKMAPTAGLSPRDLHLLGFITRSRSVRNKAFTSSSWRSFAAPD